MTDAVWIIDAKSGALIGKRRGKKPDPVVYLCFTADSKAVVFEQSGTIDVWSVAKDELLFTLGIPFRGDAGAIYAFRASRDNALIAVGFSGIENLIRGRVLLVDVKKESAIGWFEVGHDALLDCVFVPNERKLITCGAGGKGITEWDLSEIWPNGKE